MMRIVRWFLPLILVVDLNGIGPRLKAEQTSQSGAQDVATVTKGTQEITKSPDAALLDAAPKGDVNAIKALIAAGANANARTCGGATALMLAASRGNIAVVNALLAAGADANAKDKNGMDALMAAVARDHREVVLALKAAGADTRSERFALEAQGLARRFAKRLEETRDFHSVIDEVFVKRFLDCHVRTMLEAKESGIFSQEGLSVPLDVAGHASKDELERYLVARLNFFHLKTLHRISTRDVEGKFDDSFYTAEQGYPPGVYELLMTNPVIAAAAEGDGKGRVNISSKSIQHLRSVLPTLKQAASMMAEYFKAHPPEETELYRKNMSRIGDDSQNSRFWDLQLFKLSEKDAEVAGRCVGLRVNLMTAIKVPPFYLILQAGRELRIASLLCTEPPCVD